VLLAANPATQDLIGQREADIVGKTSAEFPRLPDGASDRWAIEERVLATGRAQEHVYAMQTEQGERHLHVVRFPVRDPETAEVVAVGAVGIDITEQIEANRRLRELSATLEEKVEERTRELAEANRELADERGDRHGPPGAAHAARSEAAQIHGAHSAVGPASR
jgi:PAS domain S-box-containing protein